MSRFLLPLGLFLILVLFLGIGLTKDPRQIPTPFIGKPAPAFSLPRLGQPQQLMAPKDMLGQVWLLNVWATWCPSCRAEHEVLLSLAAMDEVVIIGLNYKDDDAEAMQLLQRSGNPYLANAVDSAGRAAIDWGVYGAPETFVIDKQGIIRYKHIGPVTEQSLNEKILPLVRQLQRGQS